MKTDYNTKSGKKPLYRKVNTLARGVRIHDSGGDYRHERNSKNQSESNRKSMGAKVKRGLDYTPLYKFLLTKVGEKWDEVYSEAVSRIDQEYPIFNMVAILESERCESFSDGGFAHYSGMYVDENGLLQLVNPSLHPNDIKPWCTCCTFSLNGIRSEAKPVH